MCARESAVNSIRVGVTWDGDRFRDVSIIQVTVRVGANRRIQEQVALQGFFRSLKRLQEVCEPILPSDRI